ncbi:hypothetical protein SK128_012686, partial [Halocaridina rubra]
MDHVASMNQEENLDPRPLMILIKLKDRQGNFYYETYSNVSIDMVNYNFTVRDNAYGTAGDCWRGMDTISLKPGEAPSECNLLNTPLKWSSVNISEATIYVRPMKYDRIIFCVHNRDRTIQSKAIRGHTIRRKTNRRKSNRRTDVPPQGHFTVKHREDDLIKKR